MYWESETEYISYFKSQYFKILLLTSFSFTCRNSMHSKSLYKPYQLVISHTGDNHQAYLNEPAHNTLQELESFAPPNCFLKLF